MFRSTGAFDKLIEKATSNLLLETDWNSIMTICDYIRQGDVQPKYALNSIKKKLYASNPHVNLYALQILESCVKNCGFSFQSEVAKVTFMSELRELLKFSTNEKVREKILELIQCWAHAFRKEPSFRAVVDVHNLMKAEGHKFPVFKESDAMFMSDTAPQWAEGDCCHRCRVQFSVVQRKHHCRNCGQIFCGKCSAKQSIIPRFGIEKEVRVCDTCYEQLNKSSPAVGGPELKTKLDSVSSNDSPVKSSPGDTKSPSAPPSKTETELQEEEDLQMAIALSKSEAESHEKPRISAELSTYSTITESTNNNCNHTKETTQQFEELETPEIEKYLDRDYWEQKSSDHRSQSPAPSAPIQSVLKLNNEEKITYATLEKQENDPKNNNIETFVTSLRSTLEMFMNRMNSNQTRGRPIANDSTVQSLFINITNMHSQLLKFIQEQDDGRVHFECLQDKLSQIRDARAALDSLRDEHQERLRMEAEEAERARQQQMAQKLEIMRKKKQEYLEYQRNLALQRVHEQERELQIRQEQNKYLWQAQGIPCAAPMPPGAVQIGTPGEMMSPPMVVHHQPGQVYEHTIPQAPVNYGMVYPQQGAHQVSQSQSQHQVTGQTQPPHMIPMTAVTTPSQVPPASVVYSGYGQPTPADYSAWQRPPIQMVSGASDGPQVTHASGGQMVPSPPQQQPPPTMHIHPNMHQMHHQLNQQPTPVHGQLEMNGHKEQIQSAETVKEELLISFD